MRPVRSPSRSFPCWLAGVLLALAPAGPARAGATPGERQKILQRLDEQRRRLADMKGLCFVEETQGDQKVAREALVYQRKTDGGGLVLLFTRPKTEEGSGYLRLEHNLWFYDARLGRWERRTERERLAGTNLRRSDFASFEYSEAFELTDESPEQLGANPVRKVTLKAREGVDAPFPTIQLWLDKDDVPLKTQEFALSGKLLRTSLVVKKMKVSRKDTGEEFWYPKELRIFDEVDKSRTTTMVFKAIELGPGPADVFTKAWLEGKSR